MIHIKGEKTAIARRMMTMADQTRATGGSIPCACCNAVKPYDDIDYIETYVPSDKMIIRGMQAGLTAAFFICKQCSSDIPEKEVFKRAQRCLIEQYGLLKSGHKPLDTGGAHRHKSVKSIMGGPGGDGRIINPSEN